MGLRKRKTLGKGGCGIRRGSGRGKGGGRISRLIYRGRQSQCGRVRRRRREQGENYKKEKNEGKHGFLDIDEKKWRIKRGRERGQV